MRLLPLILAVPMLAACTPAQPLETVACEGVPQIELDGRLHDRAAMLDTAGRNEVTQALANYQAATGRQLVIATVPTLNGRRVDDYAHCLGNRWRIGDAKRNDGVLILLAKSDRQMRIATGRGAEALLTDDEALSIVKQMTPRFANGQVAAGLLVGINGIKAEMGSAR
ncbi:MAG: TPM domain-containing protein [Sphingopyxis sp.]|nr:TPM domain-containing protein [Sphingopyxis sp.]